MGRPWTKCFWIKVARMNIGSMIMIPAAEIRCQSTPSSAWNIDKPTGIVTALFVVMMTAKRNSFHARMKQKIAAVMTPGSYMGRTTFKIT